MDEDSVGGPRPSRRPDPSPGRARHGRTAASPGSGPDPARTRATPGPPPRSAASQPERPSGARWDGRAAGGAPVRSGSGPGPPRPPGGLGCEGNSAAEPGRGGAGSRAGRLRCRPEAPRPVDAGRGGSGPAVAVGKRERSTGQSNFGTAPIAGFKANRAARVATAREVKRALDVGKLSLRSSCPSLRVRV